MSKTGFVLERSQDVETLGLTVEEYTHVTGARHYHLAADHDENVFMVAFRTVPRDSTGVAHVLEHTLLCGSEKFPVRDPFFMMTRRSLNTFMNAFTASDYTAYPFASQNRRDYFNLMEVYLDAVFFPRLDPLDFAQEGHRVEFATPDDPTTPLVYKGVVFNEMKGDASSPMSMLYHAVQERLYPGSIYHHNSGGDPRVIPRLSYEQLVNFHQAHYHPANAIFMTFGDLGARALQEKMEAHALSRCRQAEMQPIRVKPEVRYKTPQYDETTYPVDSDDLSKKTHIVIAWLLGRNIDLDMLLRCHLLSDLLLDTSASPLRQALEKSPLATGASPLCGLEEDHMEMNFVAGVEGSEPEHADKIEALVLDVLKEMAGKGVAAEKLEAVLHQLELAQREIGGDGVPYGLQLAFSCLPAAVHGGDPIALLDMEQALGRLRNDAKDPAFVKTLARELLLDNTHRLRLVMKPDPSLGARLVDEEKQALEERRSKLSADERTNLLRMADHLKQRQEQVEDLSILPQVTLADIPTRKSFPRPALQRVAGVPVTVGRAGTNGITYHRVVSALPDMGKGLAELLPIYTQVVTEVGSARRGYLETQHVQHSASGGITAFASIGAHAEDTSGYRGFLAFSSRTLNPKLADMLQLLKDTCLSPRFDELARLKELTQQLAARRRSAIADSGHQYAMFAAAARLSAVAGVNDFLNGIPGLMRLVNLADELDDPAKLEAFAQRLDALHCALRQNAGQFLLITEPGFMDQALDMLAGLWADQQTETAPAGFEMAAPAAQNDRAFVVTTQVNHCASAFATVPGTHPDSPTLSILAGVLRNHFLHGELREKGGAYGGGASHDGTNGVFRFYSYQDPRLSETFETFKRAVDWILSAEISDAMLEEAILAVIGNIDAPGSPAGELRQAFHQGLFGRDADYREKMRSRYLDIRREDLQRVAELYLTTTPSRAVVTSENRLHETASGFETVRVNEA